jgi:hypothetical protein
MIFLLLADTSLNFIASLVCLLINHLREKQQCWTKYEWCFLQILYTDTQFYVNWKKCFSTLLNLDLLQENVTEQSKIHCWH